MATEYRAILRDVSQIVIGELVEDNENNVILRKPAILHVGSNNGGNMNLQFIPLELINLEPVISVRNLLAPEKQEEAVQMSFDKRGVLITDLPLNDQIFNGYAESINPNRIVTPPNPGALVGADGKPLPAPDEPPKVQDLF